MEAYPDARGLVLVAVEQLRDLAAHLAHLHLLLVPQQLDPRHGHLERNLAETPQEQQQKQAFNFAPRRNQRKKEEARTRRQKRSGLTTCRA